MDISGPVAPEQPARTGGGRLVGCLSGCLGALGTVAASVVAVAGVGWELVQPHQVDQVSVADGSCSLEWWRSALGDARYRIRCDADRPLDLERFKLLSGPAGVPWVESVEDWGQRPWEDQRPMSGDAVTVDGGRDWRYDGRISMGPVPWFGPAGEVRLSMVVDEQPVTLKATEGRR